MKRDGMLAPACLWTGWGLAGAAGSGGQDESQAVPQLGEERGKECYVVLGTSLGNGGGQCAGNGRKRIWAGHKITS